MTSYRTGREKREHWASMEFLADRELAERQPCPGPPLGCGAEPGQTCTNPLTGRELLYPAHVARYPKRRTP